MEESFLTRRIAPDLLALLEDPKHVGPTGVIISLSPERDTQEFADMLRKWLTDRWKRQAAQIDSTEDFIFASLLSDEIRALPEAFAEIRMIWYDAPCHALLDKSIWCINALPGQRVFCADGEGICWAVIDSGIDPNHPHFQKHRNVKGDWQDFVGIPDRGDLAGHGTAVAGIIAGEGGGDALDLIELGLGTEPMQTVLKDCQFSGIAPKAKVMDLRVLDAQFQTPSSRLIQAMRYIRTDINRRTLVVHGANISVGRRFDPQVYGAGHSPLCEEANRLVDSGVVVCVAAGNDGYLPLEVGGKDMIVPKLMNMSINDPGNAEKVITVGSCHKENPHTYGISYFSSRGPTSDGLLKPDLIAPGEKVFSCRRSDDYSKDTQYALNSGTSFASPHVSGAIAAFLSAKREFIGRPLDVKRVFMASATDLGRDQYFQGRGLVNVLRALESV